MLPASTACPLKVIAPELDRTPEKLVLLVKTTLLFRVSALGANSVPPVKITVPAAKAFGLPTIRVPAESVVPPV